MERIKLFVMDVDGTLTDGKLYFADSGEMFKAFSIKDGYGIKVILPRHGIVPVVITGRKSKIVEARTKDLDIAEVYQGVSDKGRVLSELIRKYDCAYKDVAYIGDDENDLPVIKLCGITGCPNDAEKQVKASVNYICKRNGGEGAVREFIEYLIKKMT